MQQGTHRWVALSLFVAGWAGALLALAVDWRAAVAGALVVEILRRASWHGDRAMGSR